MPAHIDPVNGDCEELQPSCPWAQIGCPETKVCKYLRLLNAKEQSFGDLWVGCVLINGLHLNFKGNQQFFKNFQMSLG